MAVVSKRSRSDVPSGADGLDAEVLRGMYRAMLLTRVIEERGHALYRQGRIPGSFYTGRGNEAAAVGTAWAMAPQDVGCPTQRDLGVQGPARHRRRRDRGARSALSRDHS